MEFMNYIIDLPEQITEEKSTKEDEQEVSLGNAFFKEMEEFFKKIESEKKVKQMKSFKKNGLKKTESEEEGAEK